MNARRMRWAAAFFLVVSLILCWGGGTRVFASTVTATPQELAATTDNVAAPPQFLTQFPDVGDLDLSLAPPPIRPMSDFAADPAALTKDQALIPLPPAAWTGLSGLAAAGLVGSLKVARRFLLP